MPNSIAIQPNKAAAPLGEGTLAALHNVPILQSLDDQTIHCLDGAAERWLEHGETLIRQGEKSNDFFILLEGSIRIHFTSAEGHEQTVWVMPAGSSFGEVPLLAGIPATASLRAEEHCHLLQLSEEHFWRLMTECPGVRKAILGNMAMRLAKSQQTTFQQEKMAALGTLAAGLMHELNNPGAAARRASTQLRENLMRMHRLTAKFSRIQLTAEQKDCLYDLQEFALAPRPVVAMGALDQADAEQALADWMESANIEDAWKLAPTLVSIGVDIPRLDCARTSFTPEVFSDTINWLEALVSSMQLVGTIEESIGRVTELVGAVKSYAYEGRGQKQSIDVNRSIIATLIIVGHKLREKQVVLQKSLEKDLPILQTDCQGINQIWTNLLDNAIDAVPTGGHIGIKTWSEKRENGGTDLCIMVKDDGSGIPAEVQPHIFDTFYTTKPVGIGTGLGLGIVHRIVEQFGGTIRFTSMPGETEFVVRLPKK